MNYNNVIGAYQKDGIIGASNVIIGKLGIKYRIHNQIDRRLIFLENKIRQLSSNTVMNGIFKGMIISEDKFWGNNYKDIPSKLLGTYEIEVQNKLALLQKENTKKYLINLGGGDGFYAIGALKSKLFENVIVYELSPNGQRVISMNARLNKIQDNLIIKPKAKREFLKNEIFYTIDLKECIFLIDIEGDEFNLLDNDNLILLSDSILIIEYHDFKLKVKSESKEFFKRIEEFFSIEILTTGSRDLSTIDAIKDFEDIDRWLLVSEARPCLMKWLVCRPLSKN